jgi:hypothetical protein
MRDIKFRAWHNASNEMFYNVSIKDGKWSIQVSKNLQICGKQNIMQFTGMHDKNGKEIYEGDIVLIREGIAVITFYCGSFWCSFWTLLLLSDRGVEVEVIGNIYENPELIK